MADCYVGEIRMFVGKNAPTGWSFCQGQVLNVTGNEVLFSLLGAQFGGNGTTTFALPDLRGRLTIGSGTGANPALSPRVLAQAGGSETVAVKAAEMLNHTHQISVTSANATATTAGPTVTFGTVGQNQVLYVDTSKQTTATALFSPLSVSTAGGSQAHDNTMPTTVLNYIIALQGLYPQLNP